MLFPVSFSLSFVVASNLKSLNQYSLSNSIYSLEQINISQLLFLYHDKIKALQINIA